MVVIGWVWATEPPEEILIRQEGSFESSTPASMTSIDVDATLPEQEDLAGAIGRSTGATVQRLGGLGEFATVRLRGSSSRQVEVALDGVPLNPDGSGAVDLSSLPLRAFRRVDVWRGQAPVGLGGTAMGGTVNLVTGEDAVTAASTTVGPWSTSRIRALVARPGVWVAGQASASNGNSRWYDDGGTRFTDVDDVVRVRENNDQRSGGLLTRFQTGETLSFTVLNDLAAKEAGLAGATTLPFDAVRYRSIRNFTVAQIEHEGSRIRLHHHEQLEAVEDPLDELTFASDDRFQTRSTGVDGLLTGVRDKVRGSVWLRARRDARVAQAHRWVVQGQAGATWVTDRFTFTPAVAVSRITARGAGTSDALQVLPRAGLLTRLRPGWWVKANMGRTYRPPDLLELFGNRGSLAGRADLRPERGVFGDVAIRWEGDDRSVQIGGFWTTSVDGIVYIQNAQRIGVPVNLGRTRVRGIEAAWAINEGAFSHQGALTVQEAVDRSADVASFQNRLPQLPWVIGNVQTGVHHGSWRFGHGFQFQDATFADTTNLVRRAPRARHSLFGRYERKGLAVEVDVRNVLGTRTERVPANPFVEDGPTARRAVTDFAGYPLPGRSVWLTLRFEE